MVLGPWISLFCFRRARVSRYGPETDGYAVGINVDVKYGRRWYPATLARNRGRGAWDVSYPNGEKEAGVSSERIRAHTRVIPTVGGDRLKSHIKLAE